MTKTKDLLFLSVFICVHLWPIVFGTQPPMPPSVKTAVAMKRPAGALHL
jgi:hypothetical protein